MIYIIKQCNTVMQLIQLRYEKSYTTGIATTYQELYNPFAGGSIWVDISTSAANNIRGNMVVIVL